MRFFFASCFAALALVPLACGLTLEVGAQNDDDAGAIDASSGRADTGSPVKPPTCTPKSPNEVCDGRECGVVSDGCAGSLDCGGCEAGSCQDGTCKEGPCQVIPREQACAGKCGTVSDGCSSAYDCGGCATREICTDNACICQPRSKEEACARIGCGPQPDGCGGSDYDCGTCNTGFACNAGTCVCNAPDPCLARVDGTCGLALDVCTGTSKRCGCEAAESCVYVGGALGTGVCTPTAALCAETPKRCQDTYGEPICGPCAPPDVCRNGFCRGP